MITQFVPRNVEGPGSTKCWWTAQHDFDLFRHSMTLDYSDTGWHHIFLYGRYNKASDAYLSAVNAKRKQSGEDPIEASSLGILTETDLKHRVLFILKCLKTKLFESLCPPAQDAQPSSVPPSHSSSSQPTTSSTNELGQTTKTIQSNIQNGTSTNHSNQSLSTNNSQSNQLIHTQQPIGLLSFHQSTNQMTSNPMTSNQMTSNLMTSNPMTSNPMTSNPMTSNPMTSNLLQMYQSTNQTQYMQDYIHHMAQLASQSLTQNRQMTSHPGQSADRGAVKNEAQEINNAYFRAIHQAHTQAALRQSVPQFTEMLQNSSTLLAAQQGGPLPSTASTLSAGQPTDSTTKPVISKAPTMSAGQPTNSTTKPLLSNISNARTEQIIDLTMDEDDS
eukprot:CAMPEP_0182437166 /NCGR_PEP_ID=MMETSP1167-20130531/84859_1 /TAXON_ID=2988 /ORGANISM="Mallomonas Sp, Strain CCMP3275" /LENGTH=387 /DNA_ID=CAMNT_0024629981 /DNA_START=185 /DNA_END=1348 /DNA_ORIENTATION=+